MSIVFQFVYRIPVDMLAFYHLLLSMILVASFVSIDQTDAGELTFELPDNEKMCFHEFVEKGVECVLEFQVECRCEL